MNPGMTPAWQKQLDAVPDPPRYWRDETGGTLAAAVRSYLDNPEAITMDEVMLLRAYFKQWVNSSVWDLNPVHNDQSRAILAHLRADAHWIRSPQDVAAWLRAARRSGLDPL